MLGEHLKNVCIINWKLKISPFLHGDFIHNFTKTFWGKTKSFYKALKKIHCFCAKVKIILFANMYFRFIFWAKKLMKKYRKSKFLSYAYSRVSPTPNLYYADRWNQNQSPRTAAWLQFSGIQMFSIFIIREINFSLPDGHTWIECVINVKKYLCLDKLLKFITVNAYNGYMCFRIMTIRMNFLFLLFCFFTFCFCWKWTIRLIDDHNQLTNWASWK